MIPLGTMPSDYLLPPLNQALRGLVGLSLSLSLSLQITDTDRESELVLNLPAISTIRPSDVLIFNPGGILQSVVMSSTKQWELLD